MEINSLNNPYRRRRGNRSGGRNRNRNRQSQNHNRNDRRGRGRNRNRNQGGSRRKAPPKPTAWQKFLSTVTFGVLGKPKRKSGGKPTPRRKPESRPTASKPTASKPKGEGEKPKSAEKKRHSRRTEVTSGRLYVGNLDYSANEEQLDELFRGAGNVVKSEVVTNARTQQSKGFAFVEMGSIGEAKRAVEILDDQDFMGRRLIVTGARSEGPKSGDSEKAESSESSDGSVSDEATSETPASEAPASETPAESRS